jgi:hypothetical protein
MTQSSGPDYRFMPVPTRRDVRRTLQTVRARRYPVLACGAGSDLLDASGRTAGYLVFARFASAAIRTSRKSRTASRAILIKTARSPSASSKTSARPQAPPVPGGFPRLDSLSSWLRSVRFGRRSRLVRWPATRCSPDRESSTRCPDDEVAGRAWSRNQEARPAGRPRR